MNSDGRENNSPVEINRKMVQTILTVTSHYTYQQPINLNCTVSKDRINFITCDKKNQYVWSVF